MSSKNTPPVIGVGSWVGDVVDSVSVVVVVSSPDVPEVVGSGSVNSCSVLGSINSCVGCFALVL